MSSGSGSLAAVCPHCLEPVSTGLEVLIQGPLAQECPVCGDVYDSPSMVPEAELLELRVRELEPWRHDIDLGPFSTHDVAEAEGAYTRCGHPAPRIAAVEQFSPPTTGTVLDVGCGPGGIALALAAAHWDVVGIDVDERAIRQATLANDVRGQDVDFRQADLWEVLPREDAFAYVVCAGTLYHVHETAPEAFPSAPAAEAEIVDRLLATSCGGVLIETNPREWLADHIRETDGWRVVVDLPATMSRPGNRHVVGAISQEMLQ